MRRGIIVILVGALAALAIPAAAAAKSKAKPARYYLALGDSLSQGQQPNLAGISTNTDQAYTDDLYAVERTRIKNLRLVKLGCGGETTTSMITGKGNPYAAYNHCHPAGGSQLTAAVRFLKAHHKRGEVPLLTIDIGANDVDGCTPSTPQPGSLPVRGRGLDQAEPAGHPQPPARGRAQGNEVRRDDPVRPGARLLLQRQCERPRALAIASPALAKQVNDQLTNADNGAGFLTADVANAFSTYDGATMVSWQSQSIPLNVARVCAWTWACSTRRAARTSTPTRTATW